MWTTPSFLHFYRFAHHGHTFYYPLAYLTYIRYGRCVSIFPLTLDDPSLFNLLNFHQLNPMNLGPIGRTAFTQFGRCGWRSLQTRQFRASPMSDLQGTPPAKKLKTTEAKKVTRVHPRSPAACFTVFFVHPSGHWHAQRNLSLR